MTLFGDGLVNFGPFFPFVVGGFSFVSSLPRDFSSLRPTRNLTPSLPCTLSFVCGLVHIYRPSLWESTLTLTHFLLCFLHYLSVFILIFNEPLLKTTLHSFSGVATAVMCGYSLAFIYIYTQYHFLHSGSHCIT